VEVLPEPVRAFVLAGSKALGTATAYLGAAILAAVASAIGNTAVIRLKRGWLEPAVLWVALVGWSGTLKSPVLDLALCPIRRRQAAAIAGFEEAWKTYEAEKEQYGADLKDWQRKGRTKGEPAPKPPAEPTCERFYCSDITVEALAVRLQKTPRGLLLSREELAGWLGSFDQYKASKGSDSAHWLTMFGARDLLVDRKSEGQKPIFVPRAAVSIVGGIQPQVLQRALGCEHFENGLAARLLLTMPPTSQKQWTEATVDRNIEAAMERLFDFLYKLQPATDENGKPKPNELGLSADGKRVWIQFYNEHARQLADAVGHHAAMLSKIEAVAARLALVVHMVRFAAGDSTLQDLDHVDGESVGAGVTIARWFAHEAERVYGVLRESEEDSDQRELVEWIRRKGGRATAKELQRGPRRFRTSEVGELALAELVKLGIGSWESKPPGADGGRPTRVFRLATTGDGDETLPFSQETGVSSPQSTIDPVEVNHRFSEAAEEIELATW
jgi:hypothetical protein